VAVGSAHAASSAHPQHRDESRTLHGVLRPEGSPDV
jgi:hypothetical protein